MTDKDNITLPREVVEAAVEALMVATTPIPADRHKVIGAIEALRTAIAAEQEKKTPAWWMDGLAATLMREGVNKHRAREIAVGYWEAYCQIPGNEEEPT